MAMPDAAAVRAVDTPLPELLAKQHLARIITREYRPLVEAARFLVWRHTNHGTCSGPGSCDICALRAALKGVVGQ